MKSVPRHILPEKLGITSSTLIFYQRHGLLPKGNVQYNYNKRGGRTGFYNFKECKSLLNLIKRYKKKGLTISKIKEKMVLSDDGML